MEEMRNIVAMVTPFKKVDYYDPEEPPTVDYDTAKLLAHHLVHIEEVDGLVVAGTTGSAATLTDQEQLKLFNEVAEFIPKKQLICGTGSNDTRHLIELTGKAYYLGFRQFLLVTPYYNKTSQEGLYQHYAAVLERFPEAEFILYCVQPRTGQITAPETIAGLAQKYQNLIGIKDADGVDHAERVWRAIKGFHSEFRIYSGNDNHTFEMINGGYGYGVIGVDNHLFAKQRSRMIKILVNQQTAPITKEEAEEAVKIYRVLDDQLSSLLMDPNSPNPAGIRYLVNKNLINIGLDRWPQVEPPEQMKRKLDEAYMLAVSKLVVPSVA